MRRLSCRVRLSPLNDDLSHLFRGDSNLTIELRVRLAGHSQEINETRRGECDVTAATGGDTRPAAYLDVSHVNDCRVCEGSA